MREIRESRTRATQFMTKGPLKGSMEGDLFKKALSPPRGHIEP